jgi:hypothetical protein
VLSTPLSYPADLCWSVIKQLPLKVAIALLITPLALAQFALNIVYTAKWSVCLLFVA